MASKQREHETVYHRLSKKDGHFCVQLKKMGVETIVLLQKGFGAEEFGGSTIRQWRKDFKVAQESADLPS